jgi:hypothetical protein
LEFNLVEDCFHFDLCNKAITKAKDERQKAKVADASPPLKPGWQYSTGNSFLPFAFHRR